MFFVGSLTTILPYIGTILLMIVFHFVGMPEHETLSQLSFIEERSISQAHTQVSSSEYNYADYEEIASYSTPQIEPFEKSQAPLSNLELSLSPKHFNKADGNKAPPHRVISH